MLRLLRIAAFFLLPAIALAQQAASGPTETNPTFHTSARLVYVDVVVRDAHGNVVRGLTQEDFRLFEDGQPEKVAFFRANTPKPDAAPTSPPADLGRKRDEFTNETAVGESNPMTILLFDLLNTPNDDQTFAIQQMLKFLRNRPPGEHVDLFTLTSGLQMTQGVTGSPELAAAASKMLVPKDQGHDESKTEAVEDMQHAAEFARQGAGTGAMINGMRVSEKNDYSARTTNTVSALAELARTVKPYPGRKSLYWVSESFPLTTRPAGGLQSGSPEGNMGGRLERGAEETANLLSDARIALYPTSILGIVAVPARSNTAGPGDGFFNLGNLKDEMNLLAGRTGGEAIFGTNDVAGAMQRTMDDNATWYTLAYSPTNQKWNGQFRAIRVEAAHGDSLSYRKGYLATPDEGRKEPGDDFQRAMVPGFPEQTALTLHSRILPPDPQHPGLLIESNINAADVAFTATPSGHRQAKLFVQMIAYSNATHQPKNLPQTSGTLNIDLDPRKYTFILSAGIAFRQQLALKPGTYFVLLGVSDQNSHKVGTIEMPITVPAS
jgi:VWFA-related protein